MKLIPNRGHCCEVLWRNVTCCSILAVILQRGRMYRDTWIGEQRSSYCMFLNVILRNCLSYWCYILSDYTLELKWIVKLGVICDKYSLCIWKLIQKSDLTGLWELVVRIPAVASPNDSDQHWSPDMIIAKFFRRELGHSVKMNSLPRILASIIISGFVSLLPFLISQPYTNWTAFDFTHLFNATCLI